MAPESFTCPRCGMTSYNPNDVREGYCGHCHDWTSVNEFTVLCSVCKGSESWTTERAAQCAGVWHVYREHPEVWYALLRAEGERAREPFDPPPETLGRQFESWEKQS